jgi:hypothetical protein
MLREQPPTSPQMVRSSSQVRGIGQRQRSWRQEEAEAGVTVAKQEPAATAAAAANDVEPRKTFVVPFDVDMLDSVAVLRESQSRREARQQERLAASGGMGDVADAHDMATWQRTIMSDGGLSELPAAPDYTAKLDMLNAALAEKERSLQASVIGMTPRHVPLPGLKLGAKRQCDARAGWPREATCG